jgi:glucose 1-dehydrogenase
MVSFQGKVAIVTGASGGMGRAIAEGFAAAGAAVVAADIAADDGKAVVDAIVQAGGTASFVATDVSDAGSVEAMVRQAVDAHGRLDCAVNAAAIEGEPGPLADVEDERFDKIIAVNLRSVFLCMKHEIRAMLANGGGAIVNIASTNSYRPQPRQAAYTASKHGVLGITRSAAIDYAAQGIRINAICPGAIDTPMLREAIARRGGDERTTADRLSLIGRFGRPDEIAKAAMWLCSDDASYTYGHALAVDAGYLAR